MNKRGLSDVVTTVLIILLVVAAVTIIWGFLLPVLNSTNKIDARTLTTGISIKSQSVTITNDKNISFNVGMASGDKVSGAKIIISDSSGNVKEAYRNFSLQNLEVKSVFISYAEHGLANPSKITIYPLIDTNTGVQIGSVQSEYNVNKVDFAPGCGNGIVDSGEQCDGGISGQTCQSQGYYSGSVTCTSSCQLNYSACFIPTNGLVSYWKFEGNANDEREINNGVATNGVGYTDGNRWLNFNGAGNYIQTQLPNAASSWTLSAWFKANSLVDNSWIDSPLIDSDLPGQYGTGIGVSSSTISLIYNNNFLTHSYSFNTGKWYLLTVVFNRQDNTVKSYVNGILVQSTSVSFGGGSYINFAIGRDPANNVYWNGIIDEVRIYNRNLSASEILAINNSGRIANNSLPTSGLAAYYDFQEGSGATLADKSGNGYIGTINGATWNYNSSGKMGIGINFDGQTGFVDLGAGNGLNFVGKNYSILAWVNPGIQGSSWPAIYIDGFWRISFGLKAGSPSVLENWIDNGNSYYGSTPLVANSWSHVAMVSNGVNRLFYVNGADAGSAGYVSPTSHQTSMIGGGSNNGAHGDYFNGTIDEMLIYNRSLTSQEISNIYNGQK